MRISDWSSDVCSSDLAHQLPAGGGADERAELGMARAEITGVGKRRRMPRDLQPPLHPVMAVGAEFLRRRHHRSRDFMPGMALAAAPLRLVARLGAAREHLFARPRRMPSGAPPRARQILG